MDGTSRTQRAVRASSKLRFCEAVRADAHHFYEGSKVATIIYDRRYVSATTSFNLRH